MSLITKLKERAKKFLNLHPDKIEVQYGKHIFVRKVPKRFKPFTCDICGKTKKNGKKVMEDKTYCKACFNKTNKPLHITKEIKVIEQFNRNAPMCDILREHKHRLSNDPNRLSTDFMLKLIRG